MPVQAYSNLRQNPFQPDQSVRNLLLPWIVCCSRQQQQHLGLLGDVRILLPATLLMNESQTVLWSTKTAQCISPCSVYLTSTNMALNRAQKRCLKMWISQRLVILTSTVTWKEYLVFRICTLDISLVWICQNTQCSTCYLRIEFQDHFINTLYMYINTSTLIIL